MHATYQTSSDGHRGTRAVQRLVEYAPASGSLALWMRHRDADEMPLAARELLSERTGRDWLVGNDGRTIWYGPAFESRPLPEQTALLAHQVLHIALRHVPRERELRGVLGDVDGELFNLCADAIVNSALSHLEWLALPSSSVGLDELLARLPGQAGRDDGKGDVGGNGDDRGGIDGMIGRGLDASLLSWDTESLYRAVDDRRSSRGSARATGHRGARGGSGQTGTVGEHGERSATRPPDEATAGASSRPSDKAAEHAAEPRHAETTEPSGNATGGGADDPRDESPNGPGDSGRGEAGDRSRDESDGRSIDGPIAASVRALAAGQPRDLFPGDEDSPELEAEETRRWSERLSRAHASDGTQSLLRQLLADRPSPRTPWEQVLRTRLARSLAQSPELSWSRPTRSWLANRGRTAGGKRLPWQPGTSGTRAVPRLCLVVDVSGSIETRVLERFASEMERLMRVHRAEIRLIVGDDRVREERLLRPGGRELRELVVEGGGGTDFAPLLEAAGRHRPDLVIVLTDLDGPAGAPPPWPVVWALLPEHPARAAPFGRLVMLD